MVPFSQNPSLRILTILLVVGIMVTAVANTFATFNNERLLSEQKKFVSEQANITRTQVAEHINITEQVLATIQGEIANQTQLQPLWEAHLNATRTAAPVVLENQKTLEQIVQQLQEMNQTRR